MDIEHARTILSERTWRTPPDYGGTNPVGDYHLMSQHRDSDALERSNYRVILTDLEREAGRLPDPPETTEGRPDNLPAAWVYDWRAGHWAVGWIEHMCIRADAPDVLLIAAAEWLAALADYPVADGADLSALEWSDAAECWGRLSVRDRARLIRESRCGASIYAARRDELPDDGGALMEWLR